MLYYIKRGSLFFAGCMMAIGMVIACKQDNAPAFFACGVALMAVLLALLDGKGR
jgi:hypothetical protein